MYTYNLFSTARKHAYACSLQLVCMAIKCFNSLKLTILSFLRKPNTSKLYNRIKLSTNIFCSHFLLTDAA